MAYSCRKWTADYSHPRPQCKRRDRGHRPSFECGTGALNRHGTAARMCRGDRKIKGGGLFGHRPKSPYQFKPGARPSSAGGNLA